MTDIVERLRSAGAYKPGLALELLHHEAADALDAERALADDLAAEVKRLRAAWETMYLSYIEIANPGIDMEEMRRSRPPPDDEDDALARYREAR